jgi:hypothetical protein
LLTAVTMYPFFSVPSWSQWFCAFYQLCTISYESVESSWTLAHSISEGRNTESGTWRPWVWASSRLKGPSRNCRPRT